MRVICRLFASCFFLLVAVVQAYAQDAARIALLVGNQNYTKAVGALKNPHNDVDIVQASLKKLGFRTTVLKDATYRQMDVAIKRHLTAVSEAGAGAISFIYYSGHGAAKPKTQVNYIIPVDVTRADKDLWYNSFDQQEIIDRLKRRAPDANHYVIFDACRNELNLTDVEGQEIARGGERIRAR